MMSSIVWCEEDVDRLGGGGRERLSGEMNEALNEARNSPGCLLFRSYQNMFRLPVD